MRRFVAAALFSIAGFAIASCENVRSIYRTADLEAGHTIVTDAKQRVIANVPARGLEGANGSSRIICAEPSPDVAQALSNAISAAIAADIPAKGGGSVDFSQSAAASVAQLGERLATIQLLRDGLYRSCEAYANGAITDVTYAMIVGRIDDVMVTLLSGEVAAGAFGRELATIIGDANARTAPASDDADLMHLKGEEARLSGELDRARGALDAAQNQAPGGKLAADDARFLDVRQKQAELRKVQEQLRRAERRAASAGAGGSTSGGIALLATQIATSGSLEHIHRAYLNDDNLDGFLVACVTALSRPSRASNPFEKVCINLFGAGEYAATGNVKSLFMQLIDGRHQHAIRMALLDLMQRQADAAQPFGLRCADVSSSSDSAKKEYCKTLARFLAPIPDGMVERLLPSARPASMHTRPASGAPVRIESGWPPTR